jgi:ribulose-5-phosphate 4-epimerase/fuculose-1-phosphate aldolase
MSDLTDTLRKAARDIAEQGHFGWGNSSSDAADRIEALEAALRQAREALIASDRDSDYEIVDAINDLLKD